MLRQTIGGWHGQKRSVAMLAIVIFCVVLVSSLFATSEVNAPANRIMDADDYVAAGAMRFIGWIGKFHPPATHFPIAMMIAAGIAEVLFSRTSKVLFDHARQYCLWFGIITALGTGTLGWCFAGFHLVDNSWLLTTHRWVGTSIVISSLVLAILSWQMFYRGQTSLRPWYRLFLLLAVILVFVNGFLGGLMVFGLNEFAW